MSDIILLLLLLLFFTYIYKKYEPFENQTTRSCSRTDINNAIYNYQTNTLNTHTFIN